MSKKIPFILRWCSRKPMMLSDGSMEKVFSTQEEAINELEAEVAKVTLPRANDVPNFMSDLSQHYRIAELVVQRTIGGKILLYAASDWYVRPETDFDINGRK